MSPFAACRMAMASVRRMGILLFRLQGNAYRTLKRISCRAGCSRADGVVVCAESMAASGADTGCVSRSQLTFRLTNG